MTEFDDIAIAILPIVEGGEIVTPVAIFRSR
jgi:hypothetical protein